MVQRLRVLIAGLAVALGVATAGWFMLAPRGIEGVVSDASGPVAGAVVRQRATENATVSDAAGRFSLELRGFPLHKTITAWAAGYYIAAADVSIFRRQADLQLRPHTGVDHAAAAWLPSQADPDVDLACGNCHSDIVAAWQADAHASAAVNPLVQAMYHGADAQGQEGIGPGFLLDEPAEVGNCAFCHAPAAASLADLQGEAANGVFCQFCHSIAHAQQPYAETTAGVQAIGLLRPPPGEHLFIGPFDDVPGRDTFSPIQTTSQFCAACHSGSWWNVPTYTSFDEWQASAFAADGVQCQDCHMPAAGPAGARPVHLVSPCAPRAPDTRSFLGQTLCKLQACIDCHLTGKVDSPDPTTAIALAPPRDPATISSHLMPGSQDEAFLRSAVTLAITATQGVDGVLLEVGVTNSGAGHHVPTDGWTRNLLLLVEARSASGDPLPYLGRQTLPEWAFAPGGGEKFNFSQKLNFWSDADAAGMPGKGFARVLEDWEGVSPAPPWRNGVRVLSDTRIAAGATDLSTYAFALPVDGAAAVLQARLIYRRVFAAWAEEKGFETGDVLLAEATARPELTLAAILAGRPAEYDATLFAPSPATTLNGQRLPEHAFAAPATCGACHPQELAQWQAAGHAQAAAAPLYQAWFKVADQRSNGQIGPFCAGCHTPIALLSGGIRSRWGWDGQEQYPLSAASRQGVTCDVCHSVAAITGLGDGAYVTAAGPARAQQAASADAAFVTQHTLDAAGRRSLLAEPEFCAACHQATNPANGLAVMTTFSEWQASPYAPGTTCQDCHFAGGGHGVDAEVQLLGEVELLRPAATVEILPPAAALPGQEMAVQVRVSNVGAGHSLPTGKAELRQLWLAVRVTDAAGRLVFVSGGVDVYGDPLPGAVTYGVVWEDATGNPTFRLWEAERLLRDTRIPAGASVTETFRFILPPDAAAPLHVQAALNTRRAAGYLTSLMSIYLKDEVPAAPTIELASDGRTVP